ncbi:uncharacterized protein OKW22_000370 [Bacilli bacterium PM5-3]|nr:uncharacterized protein [Bacilli bacterium PM5-3]MDH6603241.1 uncharacterized protein [Bacilli bacterium PM5-9]
MTLLSKFYIILLLQKVGVIVKWKISWLRTLPNQKHHVDEKLTFDPKMFKNVTNIKGVSDIKVDGEIFLKEDLVNVDLTFKGTMFLPCANTNELGDYDFSFKIEDVMDESYDLAVNYDADYIDLFELTWQRLIVEAPTKFVKNECINKEGKSWRLLSEDEYHQNNEDKIDPRFEKLKNLFNDKED